MEGVAAGITRQMLRIRDDADIVVTKTDRELWAERLGVAADRLVAVSGSGGTRMRGLASKASRYPFTASVRQRITEASTYYRSRAAAFQASEPVWYPYHRVPATARTSVVTLHDLRVFQPGLVDRHSQRIIEANVRRARALVVSWQHPFHQVLELFPEVAERLFVVPLPVLNPGKLRKLAFSNEGTFRVLVPAGTSVHKNQELMIKALPGLEDVEVIFTGAIEEPRFGELRRLAGEVGVLERVTWKGYVSVAELEELYAICDVVVMPSRWEAASGPIFEAVARGIPFIATNIAPIASQVDQFQLVGPLVDPDRPEELAAAVTKVRESYGWFAEAQIGPSRLLREITWTSAAQRYLEIMDWAVASQVGRHVSPPTSA